MAERANGEGDVLLRLQRFLAPVDESIYPGFSFALEFGSGAQLVPRCIRGTLILFLDFILALSFGSQTGY
jgi:hypothetical protein